MTSLKKVINDAENRLFMFGCGKASNEVEGDVGPELTRDGQHLPETTGLKMGPLASSTDCASRDIFNNNLIQGLPPEISTE